MKIGVSGSRQRGVITIFISMLMLILITVLVVTAYSLSTTNLRAVGNVQVREEALAAAQDYIEQVVASPFTDDPNDAAVSDVPIDVNADLRFRSASALPGPTLLWQAASPCRV
jgi:hypothetical protein